MGPDDNEHMNTPARHALDGALPLPELALIHAHGADAASFLHGQLSNDVLKVSATQARWSAFCTAQGRMLGSFLVAWRPSPDAAAPSAGSLWLVGSADLHEALLKRLKMFVLRAKAVLEPGGPTQQVIGLTGPSAEAVLGSDAAALAPWQQVIRDGAAVVRLPDALAQPRWLWIGPSESGTTLLASLPALSAEAWRWLEVQSGVAPVLAATSGQFVPQMLNYEVVGGVDFRKGCYPGQEVVARSQYLGKLKRRAFRLELDGDAPCSPGMEVFWSEDAGQPAGVVALAAARPDGSGQALLAELKLAATESGSLHLGRSDGPELRLADLPYVVPVPEPVARPT